MATRSSWVVRCLVASLGTLIRRATASTGRHHPRRSVSLVLAVALVVVSVAVLAPAQPAQAAPAWTTTDLNLRTGPGTNYDVILVMEPGAYVEIVQNQQNGFYRVRYNGVSGWASADYLDRGGGSSGNTTVLDDLNLRSGPSTGDGVIAVMPAGSTVSVNGGPDNGFYLVSYGGMDGWAFGAYLDGYASGTGSSTVQEDLNLRAGPSTGDDVLAVMPAGAEVELTGLAANGFVSVEYNGVDGWAFADYLGDGFSASGSGETLYADDWLNLRVGPSTGDDVLTVMAPGDAVEVVGGSDNGFLQVRFGGQTGWAYADYLDSIPGGGGGGAIIWPISGGEWEITQGYHGPFSHYNSGSTYQYAYSLDLARTDGNSAGQAVYSPIDGTVRWTEDASGGISINMGNGYAVAMFHLTLDSGLSWGDSVSKGQYLGTISGPGGPGYVGFAHVHVSLWATDDGGNWSRNAVPFTGGNAISGLDLPDTGGGNQHAGTLFYP
ncbi:MAG: SH3 domain-containing protein [Thermomicrobiales bacterium]